MGPCDWPVAPCGAECEAVLSSLNPQARLDVEAWASGYLWRATGRRYGVCETTYRPCAQRCTNGGPARIDGRWVNLTCARCSGPCGCGAPLSQIVLPDVEAVTSITIDGVHLDPAETVAVYDRRRIVRIDGHEWPLCQDLSIAGDQDGAWQITVTQGAPIPAGAATVTAILACEFARACAGDDSCRLPQRVQTVTRQGVTVGFMDSFDGLDALGTGIFEVDAWVGAARSTRWAAPSIRSLDTPPTPVQTWPTVEVTP